MGVRDLWFRFVQRPILRLLGAEQVIRVLYDEVIDLRKEVNRLRGNGVSQEAIRGSKDGA